MGLGVHKQYMIKYRLPAGTLATALQESAQLGNRLRFCCVVCHSAALAAEFYHRHLQNHSASVVYSSPTSHGQLHSPPRLVQQISRISTYSSCCHGKHMRSTQLYTMLQDHQAVEKLAGRTILMHDHYFTTAWFCLL